ncbi:MAG: AAA family ATPase [Chitinophagaceae bacterium]|nr:AAA family ATPase [Chitinophagaceae bacterium]
MIKRTATEEVKVLASQFKAIAIVGPRQSGKTTLARSVFADKPYVSLENPDMRNYALEDPRGFLSQYRKGAIIDEAQRAPELFSYLQQLLDENPQKSQFILTGSINFLLQENISQSLAGRIGYLYLLPFSNSEAVEASGRSFFH